MSQQDGSIEMLELRLAELEERIFGEYPPSSTLKTPVVDSLATVSQQLKAAARKDKVNRIMNRLGDLERLLTLSSQEDGVLSAEAQAELILAEEENLRGMVDGLAQVQASMDILSSEHIQNVPELSTKLNQLCKVQIEQEEKVSGVNAETRALIDQYNEAITLLSQQFVMWDQSLAELEGNK